MDERRVRPEIWDRCDSESKETYLDLRQTESLEHGPTKEVEVY